MFKSSCWFSSTARLGIGSSSFLLQFTIIKLNDHSACRDCSFSDVEAPLESGMHKGEMQDMPEIAFGVINQRAQQALGGKASSLPVIQSLQVIAYWYMDWWKIILEVLLLISFHQPLGTWDGLKKSLKRYYFSEASQYRGAEANHIHRCFPAAPRIALSDTIRIWSMFVIEKNIPTIITSKMGWGWSDGVKIVSATKDEGDHCTLGPASIIDSLDLCRGGMLDLFVITEEVRTRNVVFERGVHFVGMIHLDSLYPLYCCTAWFVCCVFVPCFPHMMRLKTLEKFLKRKSKTWLINTAYIIHYWLSYVVFSEFQYTTVPSQVFRSRLIKELIPRWFGT